MFKDMYILCYMNMFATKLNVLLSSTKCPDIGEAST